MPARIGNFSIESPSLTCQNVVNWFTKLVIFWIGISACYGLKGVDKAQGILNILYISVSYGTIGVFLLMTRTFAGRMEDVGNGAISTFERFLSPNCAPAWVEESPVRALPAQRSAAPDTGVVIVNWNSWSETIEALEAVFRMDGFEGPVVVCDNASGDGSLEHIRQWAAGELCALPENRDPEISALVIPPVKKAFRWASLQCAEVETFPLSVEVLASRLWLVECSENRGFGAGSNTGIKLLQRMPQIQNFWLLNCDALPAKRAYRELKNELPLLRQPLICGSVLMEYWKPSAIQSCGARFNPLLCSMSDNFKGRLGSSLPDMENVHHVDYPVGASIIVNREFLGSVGLMCEDYFLYFEELDWVMRLGWPSKAFVVTSSLVYHKGGSTTGAGDSYRNRPLKTDYYFLRSRILFSTKFGGLASIMVIGASIVALAKRALLFDGGAFRNALRALCDGFRFSIRRL